MTTVTPRSLLAGRHPVPDAAPRTRHTHFWVSCSGRVPLPGTDRPQAASSNIPPDIAFETGSTGFVESQFRPGGRGRYQDGHRDGYQQGYDKGFPDGIAACPRPHL